MRAEFDDELTKRAITKLTNHLMDNMVEGLDVPGITSEDILENCDVVNNAMFGSESTVENNNIIDSSIKIDNILLYETNPKVEISEIRCCKNCFHWDKFNDTFDEMGIITATNGNCKEIGNKVKIIDWSSNVEEVEENAEEMFKLKLKDSKDDIEYITAKDFSCNCWRNN